MSLCSSVYRVSGCQATALGVSYVLMSPASAAAEVAHGVPYGEGAYHYHSDEDDEDVEGMDTDGIGVDDEVATRRGEADETEGLLQPAQQEAEHDADDGAKEGDESALVEIGRAHV